MFYLAIMFFVVWFSYRQNPATSFFSGCLLDWDGIPHSVLLGFEFTIFGDRLVRYVSHTRRPDLHCPPLDTHHTQHNSDTYIKLKCTSVHAYKIFSCWPSPALYVWTCEPLAPVTLLVVSCSCCEYAAALPSRVYTLMVCKSLPTISTPYLQNRPSNDPNSQKSTLFQESSIHE